MVGSDLENDIRASQQAVLHGLFVTTGKQGADSPLLAQITPDAVLPTIAELQRWLGG